MTTARIEHFDLLAHQAAARRLQTAALRTVIEATGQGSTDDEMHYSAHAESPGVVTHAAWDEGQLVRFG